MTKTNIEESVARRSRKGGVAVAALALIGLGVQACGASQVAVPEGPGHSAPTATSSTGAASSAPSAAASKKASPKAGSKPASPVRPHGNIKQHAKTHTVTFDKKTPIAKSASFSDGVEVSVTKLHPVTATAIGPGEVGGPAVAATVRIKNGSNATVDLSTVSVALLGSDGSPGVMTTGGTAAPLQGTVAPGAMSQGIYIFTLGKSLRKPVTVQVQYGSGQTVLQFSGNVQ